MMALTFTLHLREPVLVAQLEGDPNSAVSYPYLPGSVIRGALANRYSGGREMDLSSDKQGWRLFFDGSTRYLNAYPLDRLNQRTLPVPLSWFREKTALLVDRARIYDAVVVPRDTQWERVDKLFCRLSTEGAAEEDATPPQVRVEFAESTWNIAVHTFRERDKGRATEAAGAVFRYQSLAAGERLGGVIIVSSPDDSETLKDLLQGDFWLGKSRSAGYGRVRIEDVKDIPDWHETNLPGAVAEGGRVIVTLLSDLLLRTDDGRWADDLPAALLPAALRDALKREDKNPFFRRIRMLGGFNRRWGLPTPQAQALAAGSVFVFTATRDVNANDLQNLVDTGIGERRMEGFGRLAINWYTSEGVLEVRDVPPEPRRADVPTINQANKKLVEGMVERLLRRDLDRRLAEYVQTLDLALDPLSNAQLSRLRVIALNALPDDDTRRLLSFLSNDRLRPRSRKQYESARIDGVSAREWLRERLEKPDQLWEQLDFRPDLTWAGEYKNLPQIGDVRATLTPKPDSKRSLATEYTIRLVAGVLHRASQERKAKAGRKEVSHAR